MRSLQFRLLGLTARLEAPEGPAADRFLRWLSGLLPLDPADGPPALLFTASPAPEDREGPEAPDKYAAWTLRQGNDPAPLAFGTPPFVFAALQDSLIHHLGDTAAHALLHAAVLAGPRGDAEPALPTSRRAVLLVGDSHAGKTSLAVTLLGRHGFSLLSDEVAALDAQGRAHSCAFPLRLRASARRYLGLLTDGLLTNGKLTDGPLTNGKLTDGPLTDSPLTAPPLADALDIDPEPFEHHGEDTLLAQVKPAHLAPPTIPLPVAAVIWPKLRPPDGPKGTAPPLQQSQIPPGEAALRLLGAIFNGQPLGERGLDMATTLARTVPCVILSGSDLGAMGDAIAMLG